MEWWKSLEGYVTCLVHMIIVRLYRTWVMQSYRVRLYFKFVKHAKVSWEFIGTFTDPIIEL